MGMRCVTEKQSLYSLCVHSVNCYVVKRQLCDSAGSVRQLFESVSIASCSKILLHSTNKLFQVIEPEKDL